MDLAYVAATEADSDVRVDPSEVGSRRRGPLPPPRLVETVYLGATLVSTRVRLAAGIAAPASDASARRDGHLVAAEADSASVVAAETAWADPSETGSRDHRPR